MHYTCPCPLHSSQFWYSDLESGKWGRDAGKREGEIIRDMEKNALQWLSFHLFPKIHVFLPIIMRIRALLPTGSISPMIVCWEIRGLGREEGGRSLVDGGEVLDAHWLAIPEAVLVIQDCFKVARGLCNLGVKLKRFRSYCGIWNSAFWLVLLFYLCHKILLMYNNK